MAPLQKKAFKGNPSAVKNKLVREQLNKQKKSQKQKQKLTKLLKDKKDRECGIEVAPAKKPKTIENTKIEDPTTIKDSRDEELLISQQADEFSSFFSKPNDYEPKILITTSRKATKVTRSCF